MISERKFAETFNDFWQELLPLLTTSFVHLVNSGHEKKIISIDEQEVLMVEKRKNTRDSAIVSEFAYQLYRMAIINGWSIKSVVENTDVLRSAQDSAINLINMYEGRTVFSDSSLNDDEILEGCELALRYEIFVRQMESTNQVTVPMPLCGAGFLNACNADMLLNDYLIEIKTTSRGLSRKDIRQLVIYLSLNAASGNRCWKYAGFFNPRRSTYHKFVASELIESISGGKSSIDVYTQLIDFVCASDVLLDAVF